MKYVLAVILLCLELVVYTTRGTVQKAYNTSVPINIDINSAIVSFENTNHPPEIRLLTLILYSQ